MRDILVVGIVLAGILATFKRPWIGVMLWTWLSVMNPHRYTYGFAYSAPLAAVSAATLILAVFMTRERESPFKGPPITWFVVFVVWMTISWLNGLDPSGDYEQWKRVMKIDGMLLLSLAVLHSKKHIFALMWVCVGSLALLGTKGGLFTLLTGGGHHVYGPPGSFIEDNNEFALALVMIIPMLRFLHLQVKNRLGRLGLLAAMSLCAVAAIGTQSRGAMLAISAMAITLWIRGKGKFGMAILLIAVAVPLVAFMPDEWSARMSTINNYELDVSAMGRIAAWYNSWNLAFHYPTGVGFNAIRAELFAQYSPYPQLVRAAHSIYFQVLGHHGFIGLFIFLAIWISTWRSANWLRNRKDLVPEARWVVDLAAMSQVSLVGFAVGGAFLSLAYMDLQYIIMALIVLTRAWVEQEKWKTEPLYAPGWRTIPGLYVPPKPG